MVSLARHFVRTNLESATLAVSKLKAEALARIAIEAQGCCVRDAFSVLVRNTNEDTASAIADLFFGVERAELPLDVLYREATAVLESLEVLAAFLDRSPLLDFSYEDLVGIARSALKLQALAGARVGGTPNELADIVVAYEAGLERRIARQRLQSLLEDGEISLSEFSRILQGGDQ